VIKEDTTTTKKKRGEEGVSDEMMRNGTRPFRYIDRTTYPRQKKKKDEEGRRKTKETN
jgi:hypothetical protein